MKYVREKDGKIEILADGDNISSGAETIFSTDPSVYEGTWEKPASGEGRVDVEIVGGKERSVVPLAGDKKRDVSFVGTAKERKEGRIVAGKRTGIAYDPEKKLFSDMKGIGWTEPTKSHPKDKICLNCGKPMPGVRANKKFCSENCRKRYSERIKRAEKKTIKQFRPHVGPEGQIYYMYEGKIEFVPAIWCDTLKRATKYVSERYDGKELEEIMEQIKKVMGK